MAELEFSLYNSLSPPFPWQHVLYYSENVAKGSELATFTYLLISLNTKKRLRVGWEKPTSTSSMLSNSFHHAFIFQYSKQITFSLLRLYPIMTFMWNQHNDTEDRPLTENSGECNRTWIRQSCILLYNEVNVPPGIIILLSYHYHITKEQIVCFSRKIIVSLILMNDHLQAGYQLTSQANTSL